MEVAPRFLPRQSRSGARLVEHLLPIVNRVRLIPCCVRALPVSLRARCFQARVGDARFGLRYRLFGCDHFRGGSIALVFKIGNADLRQNFAGTRLRLRRR
jgi:hypothetical protein